MIQLYHNQSAKNIYLQNILDIIHIVNNAYILGDMQLDILPMAKARGFWDNNEPRLP